MPHQCLKCGKVFPSGSPEILKGCADCGGKKFFYTEQAVSEEERERLTEQANKDIKMLIRDILSQSNREDLVSYDSEGRKIAKTGTKASDWVKITPPETEKAQTKTEVAGVEDATEPQGLPTVKEILQELRESIPEETGEASKPSRTKPEGGKAKGKVKGKAKIKAKGKGKVKLKPRRKTGKKTRSPKPELITVKEPGVYNIQLDKLMKGFPIIINRDGTYLVHLPSVFRSLEKKR